MFCSHTESRTSGGFTLIELLVVIAIIGVLASIVAMALDQSRMKGRDAARKTQSQELIKALEIYYSDNNVYPPDGNLSGTEGALLNTIDASFYATSQYINRPPAEDDSRYWYCADATGKSMLLAVDTEQNRGGPEWCTIFRGPGPDYGCNAWYTANANELCTIRFR